MNLRRHNNRRWFDVDRREYVGLDEVARAFKRGEPIDARAAGSDEDLSAALLVALIGAEVEAGRSPPKADLVRLLRACSEQKKERKPSRNVLNQLDELLGDSDEE